MKKRYIFLLLTAFVFANSGRAQVNIGAQLGQIPGAFSMYADQYLRDVTNNQGVANLFNLQNTGNVLKQWELRFSLNVGAGIAQGSVFNYFGPNFLLTGDVPTIFGTHPPGELFFQFIDEKYGTPVINPFDGNAIGFGLPLFPGLGTGIGFAPSVLPVFSLGLGYGTEVSLGILPGAIKMATNKIAGDFSISKDLTTAIGVKHDVFSWIPALHKRTFFFTLGATYSSIILGADVGADIMGNLAVPSSNLFSVKNDLSAIDYRSSNLGFEAIVSKKLKFVDISLFGSFNQSNYKVLSTGAIEVKVANSFFSTGDSDFATYTVDRLIDVNTKARQFIYGAALQFYIGPVNLGLKYGVTSHQYLAISLGYKILKKK
jgi:hypothetical protein